MQSLWKVGTDMKLYAIIQDNESFAKEHVVLCQFTSQNGDKVFIEKVDRHNTEMFKIVADEGYGRIEYYYPVKRYTITDLEVYK